MTDEYMPNGRVALDVDRLRLPGAWSYSRVTSSTQALAKHMLDEDPHRLPVTVIVEEQTHGRGRLDRSWSAPAGSSVLMSIGVGKASRPGIFPLLVGVVIAQVLRRHGIPVSLKWPNDIVVEVEGVTRKLGGVLSEVHGEHVVIGIGLNVDIRDEELPTTDAISLRQLGSSVSREDLITDIVQGVVTIDGSTTLAKYRTLCTTIGRSVVVTTVTGESLSGTVDGVSDDGALCLRDTAQGEHLIIVGDVQHVRALP